MEIDQILAKCLTYSEAAKKDCFGVTKKCQDNLYSTRLGGQRHWLTRLGVLGVTVILVQGMFAYGHMPEYPQFILSLCLISSLGSCFSF